MLIDRPSLRERKKDATRRMIEQAAWELFIERGYEATSVQDIAERAMVAPRTLFRYYPSKEALLYPHLDELLERAADTFRARPGNEPVITSLLHAIDSIFEFGCPATDDPLRAQVLQRAASEAAGEYLRERISAMVSDLVESREPGHPDRAVRARLAAGIVVLVMKTAREHWVETGSSEPLPQLGRRCFEVLGGLVEPAPALR